MINRCSREFGARIAILLAKRGANVVVNYVSEGSKKRAQEIVDQIRQIGAKAILCQASLMKPKDIPRLIEAALQISDAGKIEILVHK
jgi:NAD(P)-dependent dehydrogenase (short-subunit alcohol dehydrogenase family)